MADNQIIKQEQGSGLAIPEQINATLAQMAQVMQDMADMVRATNDRMAALEQRVRMLTKVTPAQASAINANIRDRAATVCKEYRAAGCEKAAAAAIRKAVRLATGAPNVREIASCDYKVVMAQVTMWDEYKTMQAIKARAMAKA